jgi:hypothetical protein
VTDRSRRFSGEAHGPSLAPRRIHRPTGEVSKLVRRIPKLLGPDTNLGVGTGRVTLCRSRTHRLLGTHAARGPILRNGEGPVASSLSARTSRSPHRSRTRGPRRAAACSGSCHRRMNRLLLAIRPRTQSLRRQAARGRQPIRSPPVSPNAMGVATSAFSSSSGRWRTGIRTPTVPGARGGDAGGAHTRRMGSDLHHVRLTADDRRRLLP